jgi:hypothetical protein
MSWWKDPLKMLGEELDESNNVGPDDEADY